MANLGEKQLNLAVDRGNGEGMISSCFQIAQVTRLLMSVGKVCDSRYNVVFSKDRAKIVDEKGRTACEFQRSENGLYLAKMKIKAPDSPFGRQE